MHNNKIKNFITDKYDPVKLLIAKHKALAYPYKCSFNIASLIIEKGVFCPTLTNVSSLLLSAIDFKAGESVLDVFSGSGVFGIIAALHGSKVVTVDISKKAVNCTRTNIRLNRVDGKVDARLGTVRDCIVLEETFDLIIANPPLLPGNPSDSITASIFDPGLQATIDFVTFLPLHLAKGGRCYLIISDMFNRYGYNLSKLCFENNLVAMPAVKKDLGYETYTAYKICHL
jgi:methylase of polypeptide subunit release factors